MASAGAVQVLPDVDTGVALIMVDDAGENTILVVIGANERLQAERVRASLDGLGGLPGALLVNFEIPGAAVQAAISWGRAHGVPVVVDAGPVRDYGPEVWAEADVLSPNAAETEHLTGLNADDLASARQAAERIRALGPRAVALLRTGLSAARRCRRATVASLLRDAGGHHRRGRCLVGRANAGAGAGLCSTTPRDWPTPVAL